MYEILWTISRCGRRWEPNTNHDLRGITVIFALLKLHGCSQTYRPQSRCALHSICCQCERMFIGVHRDSSDTVLIFFWFSVRVGDYGLDGR